MFLIEFSLLGFEGFKKNIQVHGITDSFDPLDRKSSRELAQKLISSVEPRIGPDSINYVGFEPVFSPDREKRVDGPESWEMKVYYSRKTDLVRNSGTHNIFRIRKIKSF